MRINKEGMVERERGKEAERETAEDAYYKCSCYWKVQTSYDLLKHLFNKQDLSKGLDGFKNNE